MRSHGDPTQPKTNNNKNLKKEKKGREEGQSQRRRCDVRSRGESDEVSALKVEGVHEPRDAGSL